MLKVEKRHVKGCRASEYDRAFKKCRCPYRAVGMLAGVFVRKALKTSNEEDAARIVREMERAGRPDRTGDAPMTIQAAVAAYLEDAKARNLRDATQAKLRTIFEKQMLAWTEARGFRFLSQICDVAAMRQFRSTWNDAPAARSKHQDRIVGFFAFCQRSGWIAVNPITTRALGRIKVEQKPTDYFTPAEFSAILDATRQYRGDRWSQDTAAGTRLRALTLLMRWTGLRIRDAVTLERSRLTKTDRGADAIMLHQAKTGEAVYCVVPPNVADELRNVPPGLKPDPRYFFWSGNGLPKTAVADWQRSYRRLFKLAGITKRAFPHMLRDTFAVECLRHGVSLERVSTLLGHSSVKITERYYKPHVKALQWELEDAVQKAWGDSSK